MADSKLPEAQYQYDAFISYRHVERDRKWAEWLIEALESYRVPKALQDRGAPARLRKIFRDEDELPTSSDLNDQIKQALATSRFLIVVCSAFTPRSKWVEREIEMFNELGRGDQVLALLTEGEPSDSFPAAMLVRHRDVVGPDGAVTTVKEDKEPLAADVRPRQGVSMDRLKHSALLRLVAVIIGAKYDDLFQRERQRVRRRQFTIGAAVAALMLLLGGGGLFYWQVNLPKVAYFRQVVWRHSLPEGLGAIDEETRRHLALSYRVTTERSKVTEVRAQSSAGALRANFEGNSRWAVRYRADGGLDRIAVYDVQDALVREGVIEKGTALNTLIDNFKRDTVDAAQAVNLIIDASMFGANGVQVKTDITRRELTLDDRGFAIKARHQNHYGAPQHDANGSYGYNVSYSSGGMPIRVAQFGLDGNEITLNIGVRALIFQYDANHNLVEQTQLGADDKPFDGPGGWARYRLDYDRWGNIAKTTYFDAAGSPVLTKDRVAAITRTYDERGNEAELAYFDTDGKPVGNNFGNAVYRKRYDERDRMVEESYFGADGRPVLTTEGLARITHAYDARGHEVRRLFYGIDGEPTRGRLGLAGMEWDYDQRGHIVQLTNLGLDGKPALSGGGIAKMKYRVNDRGQQTEQTYFGVDDRPMLGPDGYARLAYRYDQRGNQVRMEFFGIDDKRTVSRQWGVARAQAAYDERGAVKSFLYFGVDDKPTLGVLGSAGIETSFDDRGLLQEFTLVGLDGRPAVGPLGFAGYRQRFDSRGNKVELAYFGADLKPIASREGFARITYGYDARGNETERAFFGFDDQRVLSQLGIAGYHQRFDGRGNRVDTSYFGRDGKPSLSREGFARITFDFDSRGHEVERAFFDLADKPTIGTLGYARTARSYDQVGRQLKTTYFDAMNQQVAMLIVVIDVAPGSVAQRLGLMPGDVIASYDGRTPTAIDQLIEWTHESTSGPSRPLVLVRRGAPMTFDVPPGQLGTNLNLIRADVFATLSSPGPAPSPVARP